MLALKTYALPYRMYSFNFILLPIVDKDLFHVHPSHLSFWILTKKYLLVPLNKLGWVYRGTLYGKVTLPHISWNKKLSTKRKAKKQIIAWC